MTNHLLLSPFHLHFATISLLRHIRVGVLMHGLLSILTEKQTNKQTNSRDVHGERLTAEYKNRPLIRPSGVARKTRSGLFQAHSHKMFVCRKL